MTAATTVPAHGGRGRAIHGSGRPAPQFAHITDPRAYVGHYPIRWHRTMAEVLASETLPQPIDQPRAYPADRLRAAVSEFSPVHEVDHA